MKISIIIPSFNQLQLLDECLSALSMQTFTSFEIIVVDGGSKNLDHFSLRQNFKTVKIISEPDKNVYDAMNKGIALSEGDWLYFMGVDDNFCDFNILKSVAPFLDEKKIKILSGQIVYKFNDEDSFLIRRDNGLVKPVWSSKIWFKNTLPHQGMFYHKTIFLKHRYDIKYDVLADYALNLKLWKSRTPILILDKKIAFCGTKGLSKNFNLKLYKEEIALKTEVTSMLLKPFFTILAMFKFCLKNFRIG
ncbi:Glycosyltransferase involved in cell wall bisynthesis [Hyunsoonleella jejuensis]|uniref:Glycosyltransferase involved in cell wall bisynthesis n=1 Tax=Hyunsoonleella jejuensis TaxID=419940 RepID=A0A1H9J9S4_9FLAO|nr:glycosyltransferase [Hyunsoonleella jejuensis]SEQ83562.1 Glycosyltransferase involved in cell wall bisynthesis [Hyunsoonleella jejuensis]